LKLLKGSRKAVKGYVAIHALVTFIRMFFKEKLEAIWVLAKGFAGGLRLGVRGLVCYSILTSTCRPSCLRASLTPLCSASAFSCAIA
jgi:hypothetical protein